MSGEGLDLPEHPYAECWPPDVTIDGIELKCTCGACPEQYEAFLDGKQVGYLRLRHGAFGVDVPDSKDEVSCEAGDRIVIAVYERPEHGKKKRWHFVIIEASEDNWLCDDPVYAGYTPHDGEFWAYEKDFIKTLPKAKAQS